MRVSAIEYPRVADQLDEAFDLLAHDTLRRTERVAEGLRELKNVYGGGPEDRSYRAFVDALMLAAQGIRAVLERHVENFRTPGANREGWYQAVQGVAEDLGVRLEEQLRLLRIPRADELEVFAAPMTRLAKQMVPNCELLFFPWAQDRYTLEVYNARFAGGVGTRLALDLERAFGADIQFLKLRHSTLRQLDVFHHTVFAHEVAHRVLERAPGPGRASERDSVVNRVLARNRVPTGLRGRRDELEAWLTELACDVIAMRVIGPAYLVAFAEVTVANRALTPEAEGGSHPPVTLRSPVMLAEAERYLNHPSTKWALQALRRAANAHPPLGEGTIEPEALKWLEVTLTGVRDLLPELIPDALYEPATLQKDMAFVTELAEQAIPPSERLVAMERDSAPPDDALDWSEPLDWRSIINGVLFWHLAQTADTAVEWRERARLRDDAARLALAGIELSEFQRRAQRLRKELGSLRLPSDWEQG